MRLEVGVGFAKKVKTEFEEYLFSPWIYGDDVIYLDVAKPLMPIENYIRADARHLPFREAAFEEICASHIIEHLDNPVLFLKESYRTLKPDRKIHLWCPNFLSAHAWADPTHKHSFNYRSLHYLLKDCGFDPAVHGNGIFLGKIFKRILALLSDELEAFGTKS